MLENIFCINIEKLEKNNEDDKIYIYIYYNI